MEKYVFLHLEKKVFEKIPNTLANLVCVCVCVNCVNNAKLNKIRETTGIDKRIYSKQNIDVL